VITTAFFGSTIAAIVHQTAYIPNKPRDGHALLPLDNCNNPVKISS
jgi:hypothetical protein